MKKRLSLILIICFSLIAFPVLAKDTTTVSPKCYGVDSLNNDSGKLYIAFLGGSITAGSGGGTVEYKDNAGSGFSRWSTQITKRYFLPNSILTSA